MRKNLSVDHTESDDILDALSMRVNETLKTEKELDDKKNNVYFWLFKLLILFVYICLIRFGFNIVKELGTNIIYTFMTSLRSVVSSIYVFVIEFAKCLSILYILFKNLKIFMKSSYYKRLYKNDDEMKLKKEALFGTIYNVLKYLSIPFIVIVVSLAIISLGLLAFLIYLLIQGHYSIGLFLLIISLIGLFYATFLTISNKFLGRQVLVTKVHYGTLLIATLISLLVLTTELISYNFNDKFPESFELTNKSEFFYSSNINKIYIKSLSKFDNVEVLTDNTLRNQIRVDFMYYKTARVAYKSTLNDLNNLILEFESDIKLDKSIVKDIANLLTETLENKTIYNYNLFKYPTIKIYVNQDDFSKIEILRFNEDLERYITE